MRMGFGGEVNSNKQTNKNCYLEIEQNINKQRMYLSVQVMSSSKIMYSKLASLLSWKSSSSWNWIFDFSFLEKNMTSFRRRGRPWQSQEVVLVHRIGPSCSWVFLSLPVSFTLNVLHHPLHTVLDPLARFAGTRLDLPFPAFDGGQIQSSGYLCMCGGPCNCIRNFKFFWINKLNWVIIGIRSILEFKHLILFQRNSDFEIGGLAISKKVMLKLWSRIYEITANSQCVSC